MKDFVETRLISAIKNLLADRVNKLLEGLEFPIPLIEFGVYEGKSVVAPVVTLSACERTEKERIIRLDAYSLTITFSFSEIPESELYCYAYSGAVSRALYDDPTLGGVADRAVVTGKKYIESKLPYCGDGWKLVVFLRVTVGGIGSGE